MRFGTSGFALEGRVVGDEGSERTLGVRLVEGRRRLSVDGVACRDLAAYLGLLETLVLPADSMRLVLGPPEVRRRALDRGIVRRAKPLARVLGAYRRAVRSRNEYLRRGSVREARSYDTVLANLGAQITAARLDLLEGLRGHFSSLWGRVGTRGQRPELRYVARGLDVDGGSSLGAERLRELLEEALEQSVSEDLRLGRTTVGPHADDFSFLLDGRPASGHASLGQARALALCFVLSQWFLLSQAGKKAVVLLDELSGQFDRERQGGILEALEGLDCQVLVTSADESMLGRPVWAVRYWIREGVAQRLES